MDSLTQIALGASLGVAVMGRRTAVWKAAVWGSVAGLLPDLDVLVDHGDAVLNMVRHRAESHSLFYLTLLSLPMAWLVARLHRERALLMRWWLALWLALFTHPLLDLMTIYGTQALQPFTDEAWGLGSIFIIDPLYSLPLFAGVLLAVMRSDLARGLRANRIGLVLSTAYLAWSALAQAWVTQQATQSLAAQGLPARQLLVTPAPLTTVVWRVVSIDGDRFHEGFYSLLDGARPMRFVAHARGEALLAQHSAHPQVQRKLRFADGFVKMRHDGQHLWLTDLRMGQEPHYVFSFNIGPPLAAGQAHPPAWQASSRMPVRAGLAWLGRRLVGEDLPPPG
ncbi:MAG: metal-dependent hydrolase [Burkholderiaceae bacterium]